MSSLIFVESLNSLRSDYGIENSVDNQGVEKLADFVRRVRYEKRLSTTDVSNLSRGQISSSYITRIENGEQSNVSPAKLKALAKGLGEDESVLMAIAFGKKRSDPAIEDALLHTMGFEYGTLSEKDKDELRPVLELVLAQIRQRKNLPKP